MDAHSKNFSLLHGRGNLQFAPLYDLVCTRFYPELSAKMAMKMGGEYDVKKIRKEHIEKLCRDIRYHFPAFMEQLRKQSELILSTLHEKKSFYVEKTENADFVARFIHLLEKQIRAVYL